MVHCLSDQTKIFYRPDPSEAGRCKVEITSLTRDGVQREINKIFAAVDRDGGWANFIGPSRIANGYGAIGEINPFKATAA